MSEKRLWYGLNDHQRDNQKVKVFIANSGVCVWCVYDESEQGCGRGGFVAGEHL